MSLVYYSTDGEKIHNIVIFLERFTIDQIFFFETFDPQTRLEVLTIEHIKTMAKFKDNKNFILDGKKLCLNPTSYLKEEKKTALEPSSEDMKIIIHHFYSMGINVMFVALLAKIFGEGFFCKFLDQFYEEKLW